MKTLKEINSELHSRWAELEKLEIQGRTNKQKWKTFRNLHRQQAMLIGVENYNTGTRAEGWGQEDDIEM